MSEKKEKKWWQRFLRNYREVIIFTMGLGLGLLVAVLLWYIIMFAVGLIIGYSYRKFLSLRKKGENDKK